MSRELTFLVMKIAPPGTDIQAGALVEMKVPSANNEFPHVAFTSEDLGHQLIEGRRMESWCTPQVCSNLTAGQAGSVKARSVLLFERPEHVAQYLVEGEKFDFAPHIVTFEEAEQRLQNALSQETHPK